MTDSNGARILRRRRDRRFSIIACDPIEDRRLSWEALGVLAFLLSKPDDWETHPAHLTRYRPGGRDRMRRVLSELRKAGYLVLIRDRDPETGRVRGSYYEVIETPDDARGPEKPGAGPPGDGFSGGRVSRQSDNPTVGKSGPLVSTDVDVSTDSLPNTDFEGSGQIDATSWPPAERPQADLFAALGLKPYHVSPEWLATVERVRGYVESDGGDPIAHARQLSASLGRPPTPMEYMSAPIRHLEEVTQ